MNLFELIGQPLEDIVPATLVVVIVSALASMGLVALCVAHAPWHWFLRCGLLAGVAAPLLWAPAHEPYWALLLEALVVFAGVHFAPPNVAQRRAQRANASAENNGDRRRPNWSFSALSLLLATGLAAVACGVLLRTPPGNRCVWQSVAAIGLGGGLAVIWGWGVCRLLRSDRVRPFERAVALPIVLIFGGAAVGSLVQAADWWVDAVLAEYPWPPTPDLYNFFYTDEGMRGRVWLAAMTGSVLAIAITTTILTPWLEALPRGAAFPDASRRRLSLGLVVAAATAIPSVMALYLLLTPEPLPEEVLPRLNGYDVLAAAWNATPADPLVGDFDRFEAETATPVLLAQAVEELHPQLIRVEAALEQEIWRPFDLSLEAAVERVSAVRTLARGFDARARLAEQEGRLDDALSAWLLLIRYGAVQRRGGLLIDHLVGIACGNMGQRGLYRLVERLTPEQCARAGGELRQIGELPDSYADVERRERIWAQHWMGWHGRVNYLLTQVAQPDDYAAPKSAYVRDEACLRLLAVELAMRRFRTERGRWPQQLVELVPGYLPELPADPFRPNESLAWRLRDGRPQPYSVGEDGLDERGEAPWEGGMTDGGDLWLDALWGE